MSPTTLRTVTVVGGSLAGLRTAEALRRQGFDGTIRIVSAERELPYDRPPLSKQVLAGTWEPERARLRGGDELDADWLFGRRAIALDPATHTVTLDGGERLDADAVVLATGASPRRLPAAVAPPELVGVHVLRTMDDCLALRADLERRPRVAVIGAGFIGSEVAATAKAMGADVVVVEALPVPLERALGPEMGPIAATLHRDNGVEVRLGVAVDGLEGDGSGRVAQVRMADGTAVDADVVVVGIGVAPETAWLEGSGLELRDGVVCDSRCRAAPGIVAAGDVARWYHEGIGDHLRVEHWTNASEQGDAAARALLEGDAAPPYTPVPYFWSDQHGTKIQFVGHSRPGDDVAVVEGSVEERRFVAAYGRAGRLVGALLWNRAARVPRFLELLAAGAPFPPPPAA
ncbi:MAG TPA: FAD-dependent oxidoreductase, partial [Acidimicrobiia bacterium]|nr:FAD-dependent oxidoreductase [Acidimicrobiia bacterium]